jgi:Flp pilus assembly protein TadG
MNTTGRTRIEDRRGVAAIEFAIVAPVLLMVLAGTADFGLIRFGKSQMANGVAQGIEYALLQGPSVTAANVISMVQAGATRAGLANSVTVVVTGPACYCVTTASFPAALVTPSTALSGTYTCTNTCTSPAVAPAPFMTVRASYVYQPLLPFYSQLASPTVAETIMVRLK